MSASATLGRGGGLFRRGAPRRPPRPAGGAGRAPRPTPPPATTSPPDRCRSDRRPTRRPSEQEGQRAAPPAPARRPRGQGKMPSPVRALTVGEGFSTLILRHEP